MSWHENKLQKYTKKLDCLSRSILRLITILNSQQECGIDLFSLTEKVDTTTPMIILSPALVYQMDRKQIAKPFQILGSIIHRQLHLKDQDQPFR